MTNEFYICSIILDVLLKIVRGLVIIDYIVPLNENFSATYLSENQSESSEKVTEILIFNSRTGGPFDDHLVFIMTFFPIFSSKKDHPPA